MSDVNKTTHVGTAITNPSFVTLSSNTPAVVFTLKCRETWKNKRGDTQFKDNLFKVEILGKNAFRAKDTIKVGRRYHVDGYLRSDPINGVEEIRIRAFNIQEEDNSLFKEGLKEGLGRAFAVLDNSSDLEAALSKLKILLEEC